MYKKGKGRKLVKNIGKTRSLERKIKTRLTDTLNSSSNNNYKMVYKVNGILLLRF